MKKETLIKKAAEHGITLDEMQAEKYLNLSDEELANIAGGTNDCGRVKDGRRLFVNEAPGCKYFVPGRLGVEANCRVCEHSESILEKYEWIYYCKNQETF
ncbi:MAG: hypothetical protein LBL80_05120 [Ruminococcus sp.]|jgi:hypothetical protein|nr:hypothetical protein [Ruminococcus sp.]